MLSCSLGLNAPRLSLCRDPNTIFRGNSLTSKCIDETMKLAGMHYLQVTLKPIIDEVRRCVFRFVYLKVGLFSCLDSNHFKSLIQSSQICAEHKPCEIDPVKLKESENLETNRVGR